jgi:hypothetical protein
VRTLSGFDTATLQVGLPNNPNSPQAPKLFKKANKTCKNTKAWEVIFAKAGTRTARV